MTTRFAVVHTLASTPVTSPFTHAVTFASFLIATPVTFHLSGSLQPFLRKLVVGLPFGDLVVTFGDLVVAFGDLPFGDLRVPLGGFPFGDLVGSSFDRAAGFLGVTSL